MQRWPASWKGTLLVPFLFSVTNVTDFQRLMRIETSFPDKTACLSSVGLSPFVFSVNSSVAKQPGVRAVSL